MRRSNPVRRTSYGAEAQTRTETVNRRVWVTAQSRQSQTSVEKHASKLASEMAAPSSSNGPQHAPSPSRLTQSADGSRATGGLTTGIGFRTPSQSGSGAQPDGVSSLRFPCRLWGSRRRSQGFTSSRKLRAPLTPAPTPRKNSSHYESEGKKQRVLKGDAK